MSEITLHLGIKTDPIECRYSYQWLFRLLAEEGIHHAQLGSFPEMPLLPDEFFLELKEQAEQHEVKISSVFTAHRELGGFLRQETGWEDVTRRIFRRLLDIAALLGSNTAGGNAGAVLRDQMDTKPEGMQRYLQFLKEMSLYAHQVGVPFLITEPMSCLAEPPTLPAEIRWLADEMLTHQRIFSDESVPFGYCVDIAHGYVNQEGVLKWDNMQLLESTVPYLYAIHLKNTDSRFENTFGFSPDERERGIVQVEEVRDLVLAHEGSIPCQDLVGYLEIDGPKLGRDYSDYQLDNLLRQSLRYLQQAWSTV